MGSLVPAAAEPAAEAAVGAVEEAAWRRQPERIFRQPRLPYEW